METERQQLLGLIDDYKAAVSRAVVLLNAKSEKEPGFQVKGTGYLDELKEFKYQFHGVGCLITSKHFSVDFDIVGRGGRDGIDAWFMFDFSQSNREIEQKYFLIYDFDQLRNQLLELERDEVLYRLLETSGDHIFYLHSDICINTQPVWKSYPPDKSRPNSNK